MFFSFTAKYFGANDLKIPRNWEPSQDVENEFHRFLVDSGTTFTEAEFTQNHEWIQQQIRLSAFAYAFSVDDASRLALENDPEIAKAAVSIPKAQALLDTARKVIAQRSAN